MFRRSHRKTSSIVVLAGLLGAMVLTPTLAVVASDFSIVASPKDSITLVQGGTGFLGIQTATISGTAQSLTLQGDLVPNGVMLQFNPNPITSGQFTTVAITVGGSVLPGTYDMAVTGIAPSGARSTPVHLTVTAATPTRKQTWGQVKARYHG